MDYVNDFLSMFKKPEYNHEQCKVHLKVALNRLKLQRTKKTNLNEGMRREVATLLSSNKEDTAIVKVESMIKEQHYIAALTLLELHLEHISVRVDSIKLSATPPPDILEGLATIIFAAPRVDLKELKQLIPNLTLKYGQEFIQQSMTNSNKLVTPKVVEELTFTRAPRKQVYELLKSIAVQYNVKWEDSAMLMEIGESVLPKPEPDPEPEDNEDDNLVLDLPSIPGANSAPSSIPAIPHNVVPNFPSGGHAPMPGSDVPDVPLPNFGGSHFAAPGQTETHGNQLSDFPGVPQVPDVPSFDTQQPNLTNYNPPIVIAHDTIFDDDDLDLPTVPRFNGPSGGSSDGGAPASYQYQTGAPSPSNYPSHHTANSYSDDLSDLDLPTVPHMVQQRPPSSGLSHPFQLRQSDDDLDLPSVPRSGMSAPPDNIPGFNGNNNNDMDFDLPSVPLAHSSIIAYSIPKDKLNSSVSQHTQPSGVPDEDELMARLNMLKKS